MNTLVWVVAGIGLYWFGMLYLDSQGRLPSYIGMQGPILTIHTNRGKDFIDWIASPKRLWRAWGNFGLGIALVVMAGSFLLLVVQAIAIVQNPPPATAATQPQNVLVIPGVNQFLPLSVAPEILFGLLVGLVVHEGGHGIMCRVEDIEIESMGVAALAILPVGAFVEPDEQNREQADRGSQSRMFAAGVTNNFAVTVLTFLLLFGPVVGSIAVAPGAAIGGVLPGSAAADAGLGPGDRVVSVGDRSIESNADLGRTLSNVEGRTVTLTTADGRTLTLDRSLLITDYHPDSPFASALSVDPSNPTTIVAVNGTEVHTERQFRAAVRDRTVVTLENDSGGTVTGPAGALVTVGPDGSLAEAFDEDTFVVTSVADQRVLNRSELETALEAHAGETVNVTAYVGGEPRTHSVTLAGEDGDEGIAAIAPGVSGTTTSELGTKLYPADAFLGLLGGDFGNLLFEGGGPIAAFLSGVLGVLLLPFASVSLQAGFNFAGFVAFNSGFYTVAGPLSALGEWGVFVLANLLFWTGWVNLNLGFFNCIPAFPLDGGHILRMCTEAVVSRLPTSQDRYVATMVTTAIGLVMLASLILMVFGPQLLSG